MPVPSALHVLALDSVFRLETHDDRLQDELQHLWRHCLVVPCDVEAALRFSVGLADGAWTVRRGQHVLGEASDTTSAVLLLATHLNAAAVRQCAGLAVHAGGIASGGAVVALAADSGVGKSTLTAACLAHGWEYVTDEALHLTRGGGVVPYPKPLNLSATSRALLGVQSSGERDERLMAVEDLGGRVARSPLHLADVVLLSRQEGVVDDPRLALLHSAEVLTGLLPLSFNAYQRPVDSVELLAGVAAGCRAWSLRYSDARDAARVLTDYFSGRQDARRVTSR